MAISNSYHGFAYLRKRTRNSWVTTLFSITMVLFLLGLFFAMLMMVKAYVKEASNIEMRIFLHDDIGEIQKGEFLNWLDTQAFVKERRFVSKEEAAQIMLEREQEDVLELMEGINPLLASYHIQLDPAYIQADSLSFIKTQLLEFLIVDTVEYPGDYFAVISKNIRTVTGMFVGLALVLLVIVFFLILNTIRLSIYARRLVIRSMQLIGATRSFIRRPFLITGSIQGLLGGLIASICLVFSLINLRTYFVNQGIALHDLASNQLIGLLGGIVLFGVLLGLSGSFFAVNRYLDRNLDELM